ncbi:hypothetical protein AB0C18_22610 [Nonomuraea muscovyensis]|uniref:hypothetical protein n=1 Tax=Nonomuraea muscovyensis TaxID=1124761 RepID=UPI0033DAA9FF
MSVSTVVAIGIPAVVLLLVGMLVLSLTTGGTTSRKPSGHPRPASGRGWPRDDGDSGSGSDGGDFSGGDGGGGGGGGGD